MYAVIHITHNVTVHVVTYPEAMYSQCHNAGNDSPILLVRNLYGLIHVYYYGKNIVDNVLSGVLTTQ